MATQEKVRRLRPGMRFTDARPLPARFPCPACGGELIAIRGRIECLDCPVDYAPPACHGPAVNRARR